MAATKLDIVQGPDRFDLTVAFWGARGVCYSTPNSGPTVRFVTKNGKRDVEHYFVVHELHSQGATARIRVTGYVIATDAQYNAGAKLTTFAEAFYDPSRKKGELALRD